jgi:Exportin-T
MTPADTIPIRKLSTSFLTGLVRSWAAPSDAISAEFSSAFMSFFHSKALPTLLKTCSDGSLQLGDAATQSLLVEISGLIWQMNVVQGAEVSVSYFQQLMPALGWPVQTQQNFVQALTSATNPTAFSDAFKRLIRSSR